MNEKLSWEDAMDAAEELLETFEKINRYCFERDQDQFYNFDFETDEVWVA